MFPRRQQVKVHIVLGTDAQELAHLVEFSNHIDTKNLSCTLTRFIKPRQTRNKRGLPSPVMPKQHKDLVLIHLHIDTVNGFHPVIILFPHIRYFENSLELLHLRDVVRNALVVVWVGVAGFEFAREAYVIYGVGTVVQNVDPL